MRARTHNQKTTPQQPARAGRGEREADGRCSMFWFGVVATAKKIKTHTQQQDPNLQIKIDCRLQQQQRRHTCRGLLYCDRWWSRRKQQAAVTRPKHHTHKQKGATSCPVAASTPSLTLDRYRLTASFPPLPLWLPPLIPKPPLLNDISPSSSSLSARMGSNPSPAKRAMMQHYRSRSVYQKCDLSLWCWSRRRKMRGPAG